MGETSTQSGIVRERLSMGENPLVKRYYSSVAISRLALPYLSGQARERMSIRSSSLSISPLLCCKQSSQYQEEEVENKRIVSAMKQAVHQRNYRRARDRALTRLSQLYPDQYKDLLEEEKERDELEGKRWNSLSDSPVFGVDYIPPNERHTATIRRTQESPDQSNVGGEA